MYAIVFGSGPSYLVYDLQNALRGELRVHKLPVNAFHCHILLTHLGFVHLQQELLFHEEKMLLNVVCLYQQSHQTCDMLWQCSKMSEWRIRQTRMQQAVRATG